MPWGAAIAAVGSIAGASMQADAAGDAADQQAQASANSIAEQRRQFDLSRSDLQPYRDAGGYAVQQLSDLLGLGGGYGSTSRYGVGVPTDAIGRIVAPYKPEDQQRIREQIQNLQLSRPEGYRTDIYQNADVDKILSGYQAPTNGSLTKNFTVGDFWADPVTQLSLQFGLDQGAKGLNNMAASRGMKNSGAQLKALERFGTDYVGQQAGQSQQRFVGDQTNLYNRLAGVAGTGQTAATTTGQLGANMATNIGNTLTAQGNARGAAGIAAGNAYGNAFNSIGNYYNQQQTLNRLFPQSSPSSNFDMYPGQYSLSNPQYGG